MGVLPGEVLATAALERTVVGAVVLAVGSEVVALCTAVADETIVTLVALVTDAVAVSIAAAGSPAPLTTRVAAEFRKPPWPENCPSPPPQAVTSATLRIAPQIKANRLLA